MIQLLTKGIPNLNAIGSLFMGQMSTNYELLAATEFQYYADSTRKGCDVVDLGSHSRRNPNSHSAESKGGVRNIEKPLTVKVKRGRGPRFRQSCKSTKFLNSYGIKPIHI